MKHRFVWGFASVLGIAGCSQPSATDPATEAPPVSSARTVVAPSPAAAHDSGAMALLKNGPPPPPFVNGERAFAKARATLLERGYGKGLTEDGLYRAAIAGMLSFADEGLGKWQELMTPVELAEVKGELSGQVVGIGV